MIEDNQNIEIASYLQERSLNPGPAGTAAILTLLHSALFIYLWTYAGYIAANWPTPHLISLISAILFAWTCTFALWKRAIT